MDKAAAIDLAGILGGAGGYIKYLGDPNVLLALKEVGQALPPALEAIAKLQAAMKAYDEKAAKA